MTAKDDSVCITDKAFDPQAENKAFSARNSQAGALVTFLGQVRAGNGGVEALVLQHYPGFTESRIHQLVEEAHARWPLYAVRIVHRVGTMAPGEPIVFVAAASAHRRAAFDAVDFLMDHLKSDTPFWKKEITDGAARWIEPRPEDHSDKARWFSPRSTPGE